MLDFKNPFDEEDERDRLLRQLIGEDGQAPVRTIDLPEVTITADKQPANDTPADDLPDEPDTRSPQLMIGREKDLTSGQPAEAPARDTSSDGGTDWDTIAALLLDVAGNRGRGVGQIVGAYASNKEKAAHDKEQAAQRMAEIKARKEADPFQEWLKSEGVRLREEAIKNAANAEAGRNERFAKRPEQAEDIATRTTKARSDEKARDAAQDAETAAKIANARTEASTKSRNKANAETPPPTTPEQDRNYALREKQLAAQLAVRDEQQITNQSNNLKSLEPALKAMQAYRQLQPILDKYKGARDVPGLGPWDAWVSESIPEALGGPSNEAKQVRQLVASLQNPLIHELYGASLTPAEKTQAAREFGALNGGNEQASLIAIANIMRGVQSSIGARLTGNEKAAPGVLHAYGLDDLAPVAPGKTEDATDTTEPDADADDASLGVVPGKGKIGNLSAPETGQADEYEMRSPTGQTGKLMLTPAELDRLLKLNWQVM